jgi:uncharacterized RDD family membrane protein YckC
VGLVGLVGLTFFRTRPRGDFALRPYRRSRGPFGAMGMAVIVIPKEEYAERIARELRRCLEEFFVFAEDHEFDRMKTEHAVAIRRLLAFAVDWLAVVLWGGVLFGAVTMASSGNPPRPDNPWEAQAIGLLTMTIPVTLYFSLCESSAWRASLGKRLLGLVVIEETGGRLLLQSALLRNAVKFVPWEFGHTVAQQAAFSGEGGLPAWVWGPAAVAWLVPAWWLVSMVATGRTPYDRWARAGVARTADCEDRSATRAAQPSVAADGAPLGR